MNKVLAVTTDNPPNMISAIENLRLDDNLDGLIHLRCAAHILNLVVKSGLDLQEISSMIDLI